MIALLLLIQTHGTWAAEQTRIFQQGTNGYTGLADTWVSEQDWGNPPQHTLNYGQNESLILERNGDNNPLVRFDLSSIPANSSFASATLSLYNTVSSSHSGTKDIPRRIRLFRVLKEWKENEATGDNASAGTAWAARGMKPGEDYDDTPETYADVVNEGWYDWDITALVQGWVRGEYPNCGLVLRDATGYEEDHRDSRTFISGQHSDTAKRPRLTLVCNPDVPMADAGPDQENLQWNGSAVNSEILKRNQHFCTLF